MTIDIERVILVVIPALNEVGMIAQVLSTLGLDLPTSARVQFVVADGGSTDGTRELVQQLMVAGSRLHLMDNPLRIQSAGVNRAVQKYGSNADVLVRCDAHAVYPTGFVRRLLETLYRTQADAVVVPIDSYGITCFQRAVAWVSNSAVGTGGSAHRGGTRGGFVDHGHHAAFRMSSFQRVGGYDETFTHNEDAELDCRQRALGSKIYLDTDIRLAYRPRATAGQLMRQYFAYGHGRSRTVRRHPGSARARQLALPAHVIILATVLLFGAWEPVLLLWPALYCAVLLLASISIAWNKRSLCGLLAGTAAGIMHLSWGAGFLSGLVQVREAASVLSTWPEAAGKK
jgi:succinoglycan biosynthesis protein ExoA